MRPGRSVVLEHWVEIGVWVEAGSTRLYGLRPTNLSAFAQAAALLDMFCGLNGATRMPRCLAIRHKPATMTDFPTLEPVPWIMITWALILSEYVGRCGVA